MENKNGLRNRASVCIAIVLAALGCFPLNAAAQSQTITDKIHWKQSGNVYTPHLDAVLGSIPSSVAKPATGLTANGQLLEQLVNEWPKAKAETSIALPGGQSSPPITTRAAIKPGPAAAAIGRFALKVAYPLQVGVALYDLAKELGFTTSRNPDGSMKVDKADPQICSVAPCYTYQAAFGGHVDPGTSPKPTPDAAVDNWIAVQNARDGTVQSQWFRNGAVNTTAWTAPVKSVRKSDGQEFPFTLTIGRTPTAPSSPSTVPSSSQELQDAIAAKSGWPTSSALSKVISEVAASGEQFPTEKPQVSGPATSPGTKATTTKPDGTVVTSTNTNNYSYAGGDKVTYTTTNVTNNYNPTTNVTTTETTVQEPAEKEEQKDECTENPERVGCSELDTPDGEIPKESHTVTYQEESVFGTGSCPANLTANIGTLGKTVTVWNWSKTCEMAYPLRFMVLMLSTFAAFLIVMPGSNRT